VSSDSGSLLFRSASSARRRRRRGPMPSSIRLCLAGLMSALALAACTTAGATPGDGTTASAGLNVATPTEASTGRQAARRAHGASRMGRRIQRSGACAFRMDAALWADRRLLLLEEGCVRGHDPATCDLRTELGEAPGHRDDLHD
jgi:hypothetical protein